jgi:hypothetical protein
MQSWQFHQIPLSNYFEVLTASPEGWTFQHRFDFPFVLDPLEVRLGSQRSTPGLGASISTFDDFEICFR